MTTEHSNFTSRSNWLRCQWAIRNRKDIEFSRKAQHQHSVCYLRDSRACLLKIRGAIRKWKRLNCASAFSSRCFARFQVLIELYRVILDASVRRFQAHKIYLRVAAAKRWVLNRNEALSRRGHSPQLREIDQLLRQVRSLFTLSTPFYFFYADYGWRGYKRMSLGLISTCIRNWTASPITLSFQIFDKPI